MAPPYNPGPVTLQARYPASSDSNPPIAHNLNVLAEHLRNPPAGASPYKVIAIDGLDKRIVHSVIADLHHDITEDLHCPVRVISEDQRQYPVTTQSDLSYYDMQIRSLAAAWQAILHGPPPTTGGSRSSGQARRQKQRPCVWIVPLSPLMATMRASSRMASTGSYNSADLWRWLASRWSGANKPDITINIQEIAGTSLQREVLRFEGGNTRTLLVTTYENGGIDLAHIRRINLKVKELIQQDI